MPIMIKKLLITLFCILPLSISAQSINTEFEAVYIGEGDSILYSAITYTPIKPIQLMRHDVMYAQNDSEKHFSVTGCSIVNPHYALKVYALKLPSYDASFLSGTFSGNSVTLPVSAFELRCPFSQASIWIGALHGEFPRITGVINGQRASIGNWDIQGAYAGFSIKAFSVSTYFAVTNSEAYASWWYLGGVDSISGLIIARWGDFGLFGATIQGDTALQGNQLVSFFSGHRFTAEGTLNIHAWGGWGQVTVSSKKLTASCFFLATCIWSSDTLFEYTERWKEAGIEQERSQSAILDWDPAALFVVIPSISWRLNNTVTLKASRIIPLTVGWDYELRKNSEHHSSNDFSSSDSGAALDAQTIFLSGLTVSVNLEFN